MLTVMSKNSVNVKLIYSLRIAAEPLMNIHRENACQVAVSLKFNSTGHFIPLAQSHQTCPLTAHSAPLPQQVPCRPQFYTLIASIELQDNKLIDNKKTQEISKIKSR